MRAVPPSDERAATDLRGACQSIDNELDQWFARLAAPTANFDESDGAQIDFLANVVADIQLRRAGTSSARHAGFNLADLYESPIPSATDDLDNVLAALVARVNAVRELVWVRIDGSLRPAIATTPVEHDGYAPAELVVYGEARLPAAQVVPVTPIKISERWRIGTEVCSAVGALIVLFVLYAVFATGLEAARNQRGLAREFDEKLRVAAAVDSDGVADVQESGVLGGGPPPDEESMDGDQTAEDEKSAEEAEADRLDALLEPIPFGEPVAILSLPTVGTEQVVVEGTRSEDLVAGPGHLRSTPMPGRAGNAVMFGRRTTYGGPFSNLDDIRPGDPLDVTTTEGIFRYVAQRVFRVGAGEPDPVGSTFTNRLTLITSDETYSTGGRLVVFGLLQGAPVPTPTTEDGRSRVLPPVNPDEVGTERAGSDWAVVLLWTMALAGFYIATRWLYRHWLPWSTWLVSAPVLLLVGFAWLDSMTLLLPSTL